jgi:flagellar biosynthesis protein FlhF
MKEALLQIKSELGEDAMILKSTKLKKGLFDLSGSEEVEVTAGIEDDIAGAGPGSGQGRATAEFPPLRLGGEAGLSSGGSLGVYGRPRGQPPLTAAPVSPEAPELPPNVRRYFPQARPGAPLDEPSQKSEAAGRTRFSLVKRTPDELAELKADVHELKDLIKNVLTAASPLAAAPKQEPGVTTADDTGWDAFVKKLTDSEVKPDIARRLVDSLRGGARITDEELEKKLMDALCEQFPTSGAIKIKKDPLVVAFVGPTGAGKTTTLAKLAGYCHKNKKRVSIITADTYKIGAIEQISAFADIMGVRLQTVFPQDDVTDVLAECVDSDVIFVDTAGRGRRDKEHLEELRMFMDVLRPDETHLVLSATTKDSDLLDMVHRYRNIKVNRLLFTKLDETARLGNIFNVVSELGIPVSYFTVGQNVPGDIELAQAGRFVKRLMEGGRAR